MYKKIKIHPTTRQLYAKQLLNEGIINLAEEKELLDTWSDKLEKDLEIGKNFKPNKADWLEGSWLGLESKGRNRPFTITGINRKLLNELGKKITTVPSKFKINSKIFRQLERR